MCDYAMPMRERKEVKKENRERERKRKTPNALPAFVRLNPKHRYTGQNLRGAG
jgi:hypothetical protein